MTKNRIAKRAKKEAQLKAQLRRLEEIRAAEERRRLKEELFRSAKFSLVSKDRDRPSFETEITGVIVVPRGARNHVFVNGIRLSKRDLEKFGITPRNGVYVRLRVHSPLLAAGVRTSANIKILERLEDDLRAASDMRTKSAWRSLPWLEPAIEAIYKERDELTRKTGITHHVDHIYPVNHPYSCGLTVPWNLQVIPASENLRKSNKIV